MTELATILPYFRPYRRAMLWGVVLVILANGFTLASPYLLKLAVDALAVTATFDPTQAARLAAYYALAMVAVALLGGAARYGMREIMNGLSRRIEVDLRQDFLKHLFSLDAHFYSRTRTGDLMSRATNDTLAVRQAAGPAIMYSANTVVNFALGLALMIWISPQLTLAALLPMAALPPAVIWFGRAIHLRFERIQEQFSVLSTMIQENLTGVRIVRAYGQEQAQEREFAALNHDYLKRNMHMAHAAGAFHPIMGLLTGGAMVVVLWYGGTLVEQGTLTTGDFVAFSFYLTLLAWPMIALGWVVTLFQRGAASMGRLNKIFTTEPKVLAPKVARTVPDEHWTVEFQDVSFRYPDREQLVLEGISFTAAAGQTVAVVGPTGAGKSTLVSLIARIYDPTSGEVLLNGVPLTRYSPAELRAGIGFAPQDNFLFSDRLHRNIALGISASAHGDSRERRVVQASAVARIHETIVGFPEGYQTQLGERGINLSGGQKQRVTLARALVIEPHVLILDDVLSAVDTSTEAGILQTLRTELKGRTAFIISHRVTAVKDADQILVLDKGQIVERGRHDELVALGGTYTSLLRRQLLEQDLAATG